MAYVPPHKRHSVSGDRRQAPKPAVPNLHVGGRPSSYRQERGGEIIYAPECICRLYTTPDDIAGDDDGPPWVSIARRVEADLAAAVGRERNTAAAAAEEEEEDIKMSLVSRIGKLVFKGSVESVKNAISSETDHRRSSKSFHTSFPDAYMEDIEHSVIPRIGLGFESEKDFFILKVNDKFHPGVHFNYKCICQKDGEKLEIYKIEANPVRHLVVDVSCQEKDQDLRIMLLTKKKIKNLCEKEEDWIKQLIESATLDPGVKGGVRWPLGCIKSADRRFSLFALWHTKSRVYSNTTMRLKLRRADRYDYNTAIGEAANEVMLKLPALSKHAREDGLETEHAVEMLQEGLKLFWDHFMFNKL